MFLFVSLGILVFLCIPLFNVELLYIFLSIFFLCDIYFYFQHVYLFHWVCVTFLYTCVLLSPFQNIYLSNKLNYIIYACLCVPVHLCLCVHVFMCMHIQCAYVYVCFFFTCRLSIFLSLCHLVNIYCVHGLLYLSLCPCLGCERKLPPGPPCVVVVCPIIARENTKKHTNKSSVHKQEESKLFPPRMQQVSRSNLNCAKWADLPEIHDFQKIYILLQFIE